MAEDLTIAHAVSLLRAGGLVGFPTETVYGLGADATNAVAIRRIFAVKGRPQTNPLIVHVASIEIATRYAAEWPPAAQKLATACWPGPLTLVVRKHPMIVDAATAGLASVGLRVPNHATALSLLSAFDGPIAAPSANRSGRISPTTTAHVREELGSAVDLILDGGPCTIGIESTVLDLTGRIPVIRRPGGISRAQIEQIVGPVELTSSTLSESTPAVSPGQHESHYAPTTPTFRFEISQRSRIEGIADDGSHGILILGDTGTLSRAGHVVSMSKRPEVYARHLYEILHELDAFRLSAIYIEMPPDRPEWTAVRDRLQRASKPADL